MNLVELMVMKNDIRSVLEFLGKKGNFQFQNHKSDSSKVSDASRSGEASNPERDLFVKLQEARALLNIEDIDSEIVAQATGSDEKAVALAEKQLREGTASAQVITHYLKLGATTAQLEKEKLERENELLRAKTKALESSENVEKLYSDAIKAMRSYSGYGNEGVE